MDQTTALIGSIYLWVSCAILICKSIIALGTEKAALMIVTACEAYLCGNLAYILWGMA